jgi:MFS transporter, DHA3 family, macrolide efflux protein
MRKVDKRKGPAGMTAFTIIWLGQFASLLGSGVTRFALTLWVWELTGQATALSLMAFFAFVPRIIVTPFAGAIVDRYSRKLMMMVSDFGAGLATIMLFVLSASGNLDSVWPIYLAGAFASASDAFQFPAYSAAITTMVDKKHYPRTSAMLGLAQSASGIIAPVAGAALYVIIKIEGVFLLDIITFVFALLTLAFAHIPAPPPSKENEESGDGFWAEVTYGFRYIWQRPSLFGLQMTFSVVNFTLTLSFVLLAPMILLRTDSNEAILGTVMSISSIGGLLGGIVISIWGGPKQNYLRTLFLSIAVGGLATIIVGVGRSQWVWMIGMGLLSSVVPLAMAMSQAIWQAKVPPDVQGRVFAVRGLFANILSPLAMISAGFLADHLLEPLMAEGDGLANLFEPLVGSGAGAGMAMLFVIGGSMNILNVIIAYSLPVVRNLEQLIPDYKAPLAEPFESVAEGEEAVM